MYADYSFYVEQFYGSKIDVADFPRLSSRASDFIDYYTRGRAQRASIGDLLALGKACCALAEQMQTDEQMQTLAAKTVNTAIASNNGEVKSETVGSWSRSYATASDYGSDGRASVVKDMQAAYAEIVKEYLSTTGLLYRGGCRQ